MGKEKSVKSVHGLIKSVFKTISKEQWIKLESGLADDETKLLIADLLLELITCLSNEARTAICSKTAFPSKEQVVKGVDKTLTKAFKFFSLGNQVKSHHVKCLRKLMVDEVAQCVDSTLSAGDSNGPVLSLTHVMCPTTLNTMVFHVRRILFMLKDRIMNKFLPSLVHWKKTGKDRNELNQKDGSAFQFMESDLKQKLQNIMEKETKLFTGPLLKCMPSLKKKMLQSACFWDLNMASEDIAKIMVEFEALTLQNCKKLLKGQKVLLSSGITATFAHQFVKHVIHHAVAKLEAKFTPNNVPSIHSMQMLSAGVDALLVMATGTNSLDELNLLWRLKHIASGKAVKFQHTLGDLFYGHLTGEERKRTFSVPESQVMIEIHNEVMRCLGLMSWWLNTQASTHTCRVLQASLNPSTLEIQAQKTSEKAAPVAKVTKSASGTPKVLQSWKSLQMLSMPTTPVEKSKESASVDPKVLQSEEALQTTVGETAAVEKSTESAPEDLEILEDEESQEITMVEVTPEENFTESAHEDLEILEDEEPLEIRVVEVTPVEKFIQEKDEQSAEKEAIWIVVRKIVMMTLKKAKMYTCPETSIVDDLFAQVWSEMEGTDFGKTTFSADLPKAIFKDLCSQWSSAEMFLFCMGTRVPTIAKSLAALLKKHLSQPKQGNAIKRFFSSIGKSIAKTFKRTNTVGVI